MATKKLIHYYILLALASILTLVMPPGSLAANDDQPSSIDAEIIETCLSSVESTGLKILIGKSNSAVHPNDFSGKYSELGIAHLAPAIKELFEKNRNSIALSTPRLQDTITISMELRDHIFSTRGWSGIRDHFPTAQVLITVSQPFIFEEGQKAILYLTESSGLTAGRGTIHVLEKKGDSWSITQLVEVFIS